MLELDVIGSKARRSPRSSMPSPDGRRWPTSERFQKLRNLTIEMLAAYRNRNWNDALEA